MFKAICLHDKDTIATVLRRSPLLHLYAIGDLDDFFWPYTNWYALANGDEIRPVILAYSCGPELVRPAYARDWPLLRHPPGWHAAKHRRSSRLLAALPRCRTGQHHHPASGARARPSDTCNRQALPGAAAERG